MQFESREGTKNLSLLVFFGVPILFIAGVMFYRTPPEENKNTAQFGKVSLTLEYALTEAERERGLGGRTSLANNAGMLFVFSKDDRYGFWMKDTLIPLDIFWLDGQGQVISTASDVATSTYPNVFYPAAPSRYVLETVAGFARAHNIATGTSLVLQNWPTVSE